MPLSSSFRLRAALAVLMMLLATPAALAQQPIKVGIVTLLSGPAAGPFGILRILSAKGVGLMRPMDVQRTGQE